MRNGAPSTTLGAVCSTALGLVVLACGGGSPDGGQGGADQTAASGEQHTHASGEAHSHEGESPQEEGSEGQHSHPDGTTHAHAAMDTVAAGVSLQTDGSELGGHVTLLRAADTLRVMVEVEEANAEQRYDARLLAGDCGSRGGRLASLTPVLAGSSGSGSSQTSVAGSAVSGHAHGAVLVQAAEGAAKACATVHLGGDHSHEG